MRVWLVAGALIGFSVGVLFQCVPAFAQYSLDISLEDYMKEVGPRAKLIAAGKLVIDGKRMRCGKRPTVMDPKFDSWGGAYPGFVILNPERIKDLPTPVKRYVYSHECGHQFVGRSEDAADCFAVKRGRRYGWLTAEGLEDICTFISTLKGSWQHAPGPKRCANMRICFQNAIRNTSSKN